MIRYIGEPTMSLIKSIFSSGERLAGCLLAGLMSFLAPITVSITAVIGFMVIDALFGYRVYRKYQHLNNKKAYIESHKLWKTISKMAEAVVVLIGAHTLDLYVVPSVDMHAVEIAAGIICGTEFFSWLESLLELHPDNKMWNRAANILKKVVRSKGEKYLDIKIEDKDLQINTNNNDNSNVNS